jgi:hypothetical protein
MAIMRLLSVQQAFCKAVQKVVMRKRRVTTHIDGKVCADNRNGYEKSTNQKPKPSDPKRPFYLCGREREVKQERQNKTRLES